MSTQAEFDVTREELAEAIASARLKGKLGTQAKELHDRMKQPLRIGILGPSGSGKSSLLNLLAGAELVPQVADFPTLVTKHCDVSVINCTLPNGKVKTLVNAELADIAALSPVMLELCARLPALEKLSVLELAVGDDPKQQRRAIDWALKRIDFVIFCTSQSSPEEVWLWDLVPEAMMDRSLLVVTRADELRLAGVLQPALDRAQALGGEIFGRVIAVDARSSFLATQMAGGVDAKALRAAGGTAIISAVRGAMDARHRSLANTADLFLGLINSESARVSASNGSTASVAVEPEGNMSAADALPPEAVRMLEEVVSQIDGEGRTMLERLDADNLEADEVIDLVEDTVNWAADYLSEIVPTTEARLERACNTARDAADLIQLIRIEKDASGPADALSLMVQIKEEFQVALAA